MDGNRHVPLAVDNRHNPLVRDASVDEQVGGFRGGQEQVVLVAKVLPLLGRLVLRPIQQMGIDTMLPQSLDQGVVNLRKCPTGLRKE
jgi:hypothetical protein